jgi:hypothetical protein
MCKNRFDVEREREKRLLPRLGGKIIHIKYLKKFITILKISVHTTY